MNLSSHMHLMATTLYRAALGFRVAFPNISHQIQISWLVEYWNLNQLLSLNPN